MRKHNRATLAKTFVASRKALFATGGTIHETELCQHFGITKPRIKDCTFAAASSKIRKYNFAKLGAYTAVNKITRPQGAIVSQNADSYIIRSGAAQTAPMARFYINRITSLQNNLNELR